MIILISRDIHSVLMQRIKSTLTIQLHVEHKKQFEYARNVRCEPDTHTSSSYAPAILARFQTSIDASILLDIIGHRFQHKSRAPNVKKSMNSAYSFECISLSLRSRFVLFYDSAGDEEISSSNGVYVEGLLWVCTCV